MEFFYWFFLLLAASLIKVLVEFLKLQVYSNAEVVQLLEDYFDTIEIIILVFGREIVQLFYIKTFALYRCKFKEIFWLTIALIRSLIWFLHILTLSWRQIEGDFFEKNLHRHFYKVYVIHWHRFINLNWHGQENYRFKYCYLLQCCLKYWKVRRHLEHLQL